MFAISLPFGMPSGSVASIPHVPLRASMSRFGFFATMSGVLLCVQVFMSSAMPSPMMIMYFIKTSINYQNLLSTRNKNLCQQGAVGDILGCVTTLELVRVNYYRVLMPRITTNDVYSRNWLNMFKYRLQYRYFRAYLGQEGLNEQGRSFRDSG